MFFSLLNIAGINSMFIHILNNPETSLKKQKFIKALGLSLIEKHLTIRKKNERLCSPQKNFNIFARIRMAITS